MPSKLFCNEFFKCIEHKNVKNVKENQKIGLSLHSTYTIYRIEFPFQNTVFKILRGDPQVTPKTLPSQSPLQKKHPSPRSQSREKINKTHRVIIELYCILQLQWRT